MPLKEKIVGLKNIVEQLNVLDKISCIKLQVLVALLMAIKKDGADIPEDIYGCIKGKISAEQEDGVNAISILTNFIIDENISKDCYRKLICMKLIRMIIDNDPGNLLFFIMSYRLQLVRTLIYTPGELQDYYIEIMKLIEICTGGIYIECFYITGCSDILIDFLHSIACDKNMADALFSGAQIIAKYYKTGSEVFKNYVAKKNALPIFLDYVFENKIKIHHEILPERVVKNKKIYTGQFGICEIWIGTLDNKKVAIKVFNSNSCVFAWEDFYKEIGLMTIVQYPQHIVNFYGAHTTSENPFFVMEYFEKGSLEDVINSYNMKNCKMDLMTFVNFAFNASVGIQYLHSKKIIHRDIKTANFLIGPRDSIKVIDFGVSKVIKTSHRMSVAGTPIWMAPELLKGQRDYTEKADIYCMSLVFWSMLTGKLPYFELSNLQLTDTVGVEKYREEIPLTHSIIMDIINKSWDDNPEVRPTIDEIVNSLYNIQHPSTQRYCVRVHESVSNDILSKIFSMLETVDLICVCLTSKRFNEIATFISKDRHQGRKHIIGKVRFSFCERLRVKKCIVDELKI